MYSVSITNVGKSFGKTRVLDKVSLEIGTGELFFLLGPSGCGKTTLLRMLAGFESPDNGEIAFNGRNMNGVAPQKRNASLVFQNYALWPHMSVAENIAFGLENQRMPSGEIRKKVSEALEMVRMKGYESRTPGQLSGGQQQRIAVARALVVNPELLLLDEPLSNLDARLRAEMRIELARVHRVTAITTVYVTHDQEEALSLADRIAYMDNQTIAQVGTPRQLYEEPVSTAAARFLGNANLVQGKLKEISGSTAMVDTALGTIRCKAGNANSLSPGATVTCFFRPEKMALNGKGENIVSGTVKAALYQGSQEQLYLENNEIRFQGLIPAPATPTSVDTELKFGVREDDIKLLKE